METVEEIVVNGVVVGWKARWRVGKNQRAKRFLKAKGFTITDARNHQRSMKAAVAEGRYRDPRAGRITLEAYFERWAKVLSDSEAKIASSMFRHHVFPEMGTWSMDQPKHTDLQLLLLVAEKKLAPKTMQELRRYLRRMFANAVADELLATSPCAALKGKPVPPSSKVVLTPAEIDALWANLPELWRDYVIVGQRTGLRPAELRGLTIDRVDFLRGTLRVERQLVKGVLTDVLKTPQSQRTVFLTSGTVEVLAAMLARQGRTQGYVFRTVKRGPISETCLDSAWQKAAIAAGLEHPSVPHDLRHHYASVMKAAGATTEQIAAQLGHAHRGNITERVYTHVLPDYEKGYRQVMARAFGETHSGHTEIRAQSVSKADEKGS